MKNRLTSTKILAALFFSIVMGLNLNAQNEKEQISTLFGDKNGHIDHGGWGGLTFGYTKIQDQDTYLIGARGGWLIDHHFTIGLAGSGFISDNEFIDDKINRGEPYNLAGGYGGLFLEAIIAPKYPVHVSIPVIIGAGGIAYIENQPWNEHDYYYPNSTIDNDAYFVFEPGLEIEINLVRFMRFAVGGSYRYTSEVSMINSSDTMLRGFNGHFSLKFGWF